MNILGIESSCDETAAAIVKDGRKILSNIVSSQIKIHQKYFGVVPELASRAHIENINYVIEEAVKQAGFSFDSLSKNVSAIAYTRGPGLAGSLLVGQIAAQTLSYIHKIPLIDINHLEGHFYAALLENASLKPPYLSLIVSGGHTELVIIEDFGVYKYLGGTRDDAAGEAFDKVAKLLKLSYPGGPVIDKLSESGNKAAVNFPRPYLWDTWDFSFSGLKTAVVNFVMPDFDKIQKNKKMISDICASFQEAVIDTIVNKTIAAAKKFAMKKIVIGGGVAANSGLRKKFLQMGEKEKIKIYLPSLQLCTDNAAMIACAGCYKHKLSEKSFTAHKQEKIEPGMKLRDWNE